MVAGMMVEVGFRKNPVPYLTSAADILKACKPVQEFENFIDQAMDGTIFIDEVCMHACLCPFVLIG